jgi:hypothetical protein
MNMALSTLLLIFYLTGCCCWQCPRIAGPCEAVHLSPSGKAFPTHWGKPPEIQTKDYVPLPYGYGHGSSTLYHWIVASVAEGCRAGRPLLK